MNKKTRQVVNGINKQVAQLIEKSDAIMKSIDMFKSEVQAVAEQIDSVLVDEQMKLDNMGRFEGSERYANMESAVDSLSEATAAAQDANFSEMIDALKWAKDSLLDAKKELDSVYEETPDTLEEVRESLEEAVE